MTELDELIKELEEEGERNKEISELVGSIKAKIADISNKLHQKRLKEKVINAVVTLSKEINRVERISQCDGSISVERLVEKKRELANIISSLYEVSKSLVSTNELKLLYSRLNEVLSTLDSLNEKIKEVEEEVANVREEIAKKEESVREEIAKRKERLNSLNSFLRVFDEEVDYDECKGEDLCSLLNCLSSLDSALKVAEGKKGEIVKRIGERLEGVITKLVDEGEVEINDVSELTTLLKLFEEDEKLRKLRAKLRVTLKLKG